LEERLKLSCDNTTEEVDATQYRCLVGILRYLTHTRPDLTFSVGYVSRFMQQPTTEHQQAVKRIIRYIVGTLDHGLYYPKCPREARLVGYNDSDHAGDIDISKSTSKILFFFSKCLVSWQSVKQQVVTLSSCEAKYIAASTASIQALCWFDCLVIYSVETLQRWNSGWIASPLCPWQRTQFFMNGASISG
jgi:hypothetical protein